MSKKYSMSWMQRINLNPEPEWHKRITQIMDSLNIFIPPWKTKWSEWEWKSMEADSYDEFEIRMPKGDINE